MSSTFYEILMDMAEKEKTKNNTREAAQTVRDVYDAFVEVGFSDEQAFDLCKTATIEPVRMSNDF